MDFSTGYAADGDLPKIISTDSAAEYWRGEAALAHIDVGVGADLPEHPLTRRYLLTERATARQAASAK